MCLEDEEPSPASAAAELCKKYKEIVRRCEILVQTRSLALGVAESVKMIALCT
jgi:hypothetical protein